MTTTSISTFLPFISCSQPPTSSSTGSSKSLFISSSKIGYLDVYGVPAKSTCFTCFVKTYKAIGYARKTILITSSFKTKATKVGKNAPFTSTKAFFNFAYSCNFLGIAIEINSAAKKQWNLHVWMPTMPNMFAELNSLGQIIDKVYQQSFYIRSYEIQPDKKVSFETLMNYLQVLKPNIFKIIIMMLNILGFNSNVDMQETSINHLNVIGYVYNSIDSTPMESKRNLTWVVIKLHVQVEHYPIWGDILEVNSWLNYHGKNKICFHWHVRNTKTGQTVMQATSVWVMMNQITRKISKLSKEIKMELEPYCKENSFILNDGHRKFQNLNVETADYIMHDLIPYWADLDFNMHVNTTSYIVWILKVIPMFILENHEITNMTLEFKKECRRDSRLQSLTTVSFAINNSSLENIIECEHQIQFENGPVLMQGRTSWRPKV